MATTSNAPTRLASVDQTITDRLPPYSQELFAAKTRKGLTFAQIGEAIGRGEVGVAAIFYGQAMASHEDVVALRKIFDLSEATATALSTTFPDRGHAAGPMPPREPLMYRLYEAVQNYGYALRAVMNEKLGDGIMSAIAFQAHVDKEVDEHGVTWAIIKFRGKWLPYARF